MKKEVGEGAIKAFIDHGIMAETIDFNISEVKGIYNTIEKLRIEWMKLVHSLNVKFWSVSIGVSIMFLTTSKKKPNYIHLLSISKSWPLFLLQLVSLERRNMEF